MVFEILLASISHMSRVFSIDCGDELRKFEKDLSNLQARIHEREQIKRRVLCEGRQNLEKS
jgi:hypothetical protein